MKMNIFRLPGNQKEYDIPIQMSIQTALEKAGLEVKEGEHITIVIMPKIRPGYNG